MFSVKHNLVSLIGILPLHALVSGDRQSVSKQELANRLCDKAKITLPEASILLDIVESILDTESTLDQEKLKRGEWQFVSYAAQLMALSRLETLADSQVRDVDEHYWVPDSLINWEHKKLASARLEKAEQTRWDCHNAEQPARPIRFTHVVWAFIKVGDKFLFDRKKEDNPRPPGEFDLPGGIVNEADLPSDMSIDDRIILINLNSLIEKKYDGCWIEAIKREIKGVTSAGYPKERDTGLVYGIDYNFDKVGSTIKPGIEPFINCRGTDLIFSVANYWFKLFNPKLTLQGYLKLRENMDTNKRLILVTVDDMLNQKSGDKKLDIGVLHERYPGGFANLADKLDIMEQSFAIRYKDTKGVIIPVSEGQSMEVCTTAKKLVAGMESLNQEECDLLLGLAVHARGWQMGNVPDGIVLHCDGWVDASDHEGIRKQLLQLVNKAPTCFDVDDSHYFRLSVPSEKIIFHASLFKFSVSTAGLNQKTPLQIIRQEIISPLGILLTASACIQIDIEQAVNITNLHEQGVDGFAKDCLISERNYTSRVEKEKEKQGGQWEEYTWGQWEKNFTRSVRNKMNPIGLRYLLKTEHNVVSLVCDKASDDS